MAATRCNSAPQVRQALTADLKKPYRFALHRTHAKEDNFKHSL